jgi:hypothetical protein
VCTEFGDTYVGHLVGGNAVYEDFRRRSAEYFEAIYHGTRRTLAGMFLIDPDDVAAVIERATLSRRPRARYAAGFLARSTLVFRRLTPDVVFDNLFVRRLFPIP